MTTTIDASTAGVRETDAKLVAVRVFSPRDLWMRSKQRFLKAIRTVRAEAAQRQAAIAQFVKPYWARIPAGIPGFAFLATMAHTPAYRWVMQRAKSVTGFVGRTAKTGVGWLGRGIRWLGRSAAGMISWLMPKTGERFGSWVERSSLGVELAYGSFCESVANGHRDFYAAATTVAATRTLSKFALPLAVAAGANLVSQGLLAALVSGIPGFGLPLAAAISTSRGMALSGGIIGAVALYDGYTELRAEKARMNLAAAEVAAGVKTPAEGAAEIEAIVVEASEGEHKAEVVAPGEVVPAAAGTEVETREVLIDGKTHVIEVRGDVTPEEAEQLAHEHIARQRADEEAEIRRLEEETLKPAKKATARQHGPQGKGKGRKATPAPSGRR